MTTKCDVSALRTFAPKMLRATIVSVQIIGMFGLATGVAQPASAHRPSAPDAPNVGTVTGRVFRDYNANGIKDGNEPGLANVAVTAVTSGGVFTGTSNSSGIYTINVTAGTEARIQATLPASFQSGPVGPNSASTVRFIAVGGAVADIDFGMFVPSDYCQANPLMATGCAIFGDAVAGENNAQPNFYTFPYNSTGNANPGVNPTSHSTFVNTGSLYGLAYHRASKRIFAGAYMKRLVGFVPSATTDGSGKIYLIDPSAAAGSSLFVDLDALYGADVTGGPALRDWNWDLPNGLDQAAFKLVGKASLADLELSDDEKTLYTINLANRSLYKIPVGAVPSVLPAVPTTANIKITAFPDPGCVNGVSRPFGLKNHNGLMYVGGVCTAENGGTAADLEAFVYTYNPATDAFGATPVIRFKFTWQRGCANIGPEYIPTVCTANINGSKANWYAWSDTLIPGPGFAGGWSADATTAYPQPMLADIEFVGENMVLGFRDRFADQIGSDEPGPDANITGPATPLIRAVPAGDVLRATPKTGGGWELEANPSETTEFYDDDERAPSGTNTHDERSFGGLTYLPGAPDIAVTVLDAAGMFTGTAAPFDRRFGSSGIAWLSNTTGKYQRAFEVYQPDPPGQTITLRKANGMGDIELLCDSAPIEIGNRVWLDSNRDGIQDPAEPPLAGVTVTLTTASGAAISVVTDAKGEYYFSSAAGATTPSRIYNLSGAAAVQLLQNTAYTLSVATAQPSLATYTLSPANAGSNDAIDSDAALTANGANAIITYATGDAGANDHTLDFGFAAPTPLAALGDFVWRDNNRNGIQDLGEPGVPGVTVTLRNGNGVVSTTVTGPNGEYLFPDLIPETYSVCFTLPANNVFTLPNAGGNDGLDSDANATTGCTGTYPLVAGQTDRTVDAGIYALAQLGDLVWRDLNGNGVQDAGEPGVSGVTVQLRNEQGAIISTTTTNGTGNYLFDGLQPGTYSVCFVAPAGTQLTTPNAGSNDGTDSDAALATGCTGQYVLAPGESNLTVDAGIVPIPVNPAQLGDRVWRDNNNNGVQDAGEPGVPGVTVQLRDSTGTIISTTTTNADGNYLFPGLNPGTYSVCFQPPAGTQLTTPNAGADDAVDSDALANGCTGTYTLVAGQSNLTVDAGIVPIPTQPAQIGNFVWRDNDGDGVQDAGEPGVQGVTVTLRDSNGNVVSTTLTDANGGYLFPGLTPGSYSVCFAVPPGYDRSPGDQGGNDGADSDANVSTGCTGTYVLDPGESDLTVDAGLIPQSPLLAIVKSSQPIPGTRVKIGDRIDYTLIVSNTGKATATNVIVADPIPAGTTYITGSAVPAVTSGPSPLVWNVGALAPNQSKSVTFAVTVQNANNTVSAIVNVASVQSDQTPNVPSNQVVHPFSPTAVSLTGFVAEANEQGVLVTWSTSMEVDTYGFKLARSESDDRGAALIVTADMIAAQGRNGGASYRFQDTTAQAGKAYRYWLVEQELTGGTLEYGPAVVSVSLLPAQTTLQESVQTTMQTLLVPGGAIAGGMPFNAPASGQVQAANTSLAGINNQQSVSVRFDKPAVAVKTEIVQSAAAASVEAKGSVAQPTGLQSQPVAVAAAKPANVDMSAQTDTSAAQPENVAAAAEVMDVQVQSMQHQTNETRVEAHAATVKVDGQTQPRISSASSYVAPAQPTPALPALPVWLLLLAGAVTGGMVFVGLSWMAIGMIQRRK